MYLHIHLMHTFHDLSVRHFKSPHSHSPSAHLSDSSDDQNVDILCLYDEVLVKI